MLKLGDKHGGDAALDFLREGDLFMVMKLDRLARSTHHLMEIMHTLTSRTCARVATMLPILAPSANHMAYA